MSLICAVRRKTYRMNKNSFENCVRQLPNPGLGLGLRSKHFNYILENKPQVDWFEIISENFMDSGGRPRQVLRRIAEFYPLVMHGVSLSIGSTDKLNFNYLKKLKGLADEIKPLWISDHLCWTGVNNFNTHDLLPLPLTEESLKHVCSRIAQVQDYLERPMIFENPSTYLTFKQSDIDESDFLKLMTEETGCGLLLDVNNVYVSAFNNDFDAEHYITNLPPDKIVQIHLAGHTNCGDFIIDTHDNYVANEVWQLFNLAWNLTGGTSVLLEWDSKIPDFAEYQLELLKAKEFMNFAHNAHESMNTLNYQPSSVSNPVDFLVADVLYEFNK